MRAFIEDTDKRIEITTRQLINSKNQPEREELISKLNHLVTLKEIYIKISQHNKEVELTI